MWNHTFLLVTTIIQYSYDSLWKTRRLLGIRLWNTLEIPFPLSCVPIEKHPLEKEGRNREHRQPERETSERIARIINKINSNDCFPSAQNKSPPGLAFQNENECEIFGINIYVLYMCVSTWREVERCARERAGLCVFSWVFPREFSHLSSSFLGKSLKNYFLTETHK